MQINYGEEQGVGLHFGFYPNLRDNSHLIVRTTLYAFCRRPKQWC